jgi:hypothetical protein
MEQAVGDLASQAVSPVAAVDHDRSMETIKP